MFEVEGYVDLNQCAPFSTVLRNKSTHATWFYWEINPKTGWDFSLNSNPDSENPAVTFKNPSKYIITLRAGNACGNASWTKEILVKSIPNVKIKDIPNFCEETEITPVASVKPLDTDFLKWEWTLPNGISTARNPGPIYLNKGLHTIKLTVANECGEAVDVDTIIIISSPEINAGEDISVCGNSPCFFLENAIPEGGRWSGVISPNGEFCPDSHPPGTYQNIYIGESGSCQVRDTILIHLVEPPVVKIRGVNELCLESNPVTLEVNKAGCNWRGDHVTNCGKFSPKEAGIGRHTIYFTERDSTTGCNSIDSLSIDVVEPPHLNLPESVTICADEGGFDLCSALKKNGANCCEEGVWEGDEITSDGVFYSNSKEGAYTVSYTCLSMPGCTVTDKIKIIVLGEISTDAGKDKTICIDTDSIQLTGTPNGGFWLPVSSNAPPIDRESGNIAASHFKAGKFEYQYVYSPGIGCESRDVVAVEILDFSKVDAGEDIHVCISKAEVELSDYSPANGKWSGPGVILSNTWNVNLTTLVPGVFQLVYTLSDAEGLCSVSDTTDLHVYSIPKPKIGGDRNSCINTPMQFTSNAPSEADVLWNFGDQSSSDQLNPIHSYSAPGTYIVTQKVFVRDPNDFSVILCEMAAQQSVIVSEPPSLDGVEVDIYPGREPHPLRFRNLNDSHDMSYVWGIRSKKYG